MANLLLQSVLREINLDTISISTPSLKKLLKGDPASCASALCHPDDRMAGRANNSPITGSRILHRYVVFLSSACFIPNYTPV